jgi:hypothetical protein
MNKKTILSLFLLSWLMLFWITSANWNLKERNNLQFEIKEKIQFEGRNCWKCNKSNDLNDQEIIKENNKGGTCKMNFNNNYWLKNNSNELNSMNEKKWKRMGNKEGKKNNWECLLK